MRRQRGIKAHQRRASLRGQFFGLWQLWSLKNTDFCPPLPAPGKNNSQGGLSRPDFQHFSKKKQSPKWPPNPSTMTRGSPSLPAPPLKGPQIDTQNRHFCLNFYFFLPICIIIERIGPWRSQPQ